MITRELLNEVRIKLRGFNSSDRDLEDEEVVLIDVWYDSNVKSWTIQKKNKSGDQVGDTDYVYRKSEAKKLAQQIQQEYPKAKIKLDKRG